MKRVLIGLFFALILSGCYTKNQAIKKFCKQDTASIIVTIHDTTFVDRITTDTIFSETIDSVIVTKDKLVIKYQKVKGKIHLSGEYKGDTIYKEKIVEVKIPCNCPPEYVPGFWENIWIKIRSWLAMVGLLAILVGAIVLSPWNK